MDIIDWMRWMFLFQLIFPLVIGIAVAIFVALWINKDAKIRNIDAGNWILLSMASALLSVIGPIIILLLYTRKSRTTYVNILTELEKKVLDYLISRNYKVRVSDCAKELNMTNVEVEDAIRSLEQKGLLKKKEVGL